MMSEQKSTKKIFKGRVIIPGNLTGKALVSQEGLNPLAAWKDSCLKKKKIALCSDQNNKDLYKKQLDGQIICLPQIIGSTTAGIVIQTAADMGLGPAALLFANHIDSLAASGIILTEVWANKTIITVDQLGEEFLATVKSGMLIEIHDDGTVILPT